jgi:hypothetical protein
MGSLKKELLELLVSLAADLFDLEVAPWSTRLFGRMGDNGRYRFASRDWFFRRIAFDIGAIETVEIRQKTEKGSQTRKLLNPLNFSNCAQQQY